MKKRFARRGAALFAAVIFPLAAANAASPNDTARYLAGMKISEGSSLKALTGSAAYAAHALYFERAWAELDARQLSKVRAWSSENLTAPRPVLFYMFSGPDFLYANALFPKADTYVLAGLEPAGDLPDVEAPPRPSLPHELAALRASLNSVLSYSFFITKSMKSDLRGHRLNGALPILYVFLARSGKTVESVGFVSLDKNGALHSGAAADLARNAAAGVKITFLAESNRRQTLYYFSTDLSNTGTENSGFLRFCAELGAGDSLLKSASYLPHSNNFSNIRAFLLKHSSTIVQDDTGVPFRYFDLTGWDLKPFGTYMRPIPKFHGKYQRDLHSFFEKRHARPLQFSFGYRWKQHSSNILLAIRKPAGPEEASSLAPPEGRATEAR